MTSIAVLRRRLAEVQRAPMLPAMSRYNLATSSLSDDELEAAIVPFGAAAEDDGIGLSTLWNDMLTREPRSAPVTDIKSMQESLINMGYAHSVAPDGVWTPYWNSAFRRSDRDARDLVRSGDNWASAPTKKFLQYLGYTVPTGVFQALHGMATGIVDQAKLGFSNPVESAEEAGLLGGAATGAVVGGVVGGPIGALAGGAIGGAAGFFADLFGDDEGEDDQGFWGDVWDALSPYDEVRDGGARHFFGMLDTILLASSLVKGVKLATQGAKAATTIGATGAQSAGGMILPQIDTAAGKGLFGGASKVIEGTATKINLRDALTRATKDQVAPGIAASLAKGAVRRPWVGGAMTGFGIEAFPHLLSGDFESAIGEGLQGAAIGAGIGAVGGRFIPDKAKDKILRGLDAAPLRRITASPAGKALQSLYTGASVTAMGGRLFGGLGFDEDVIDQRTGQVLEDKEASPIAEAIEESPDLGGVGVALDLTLGTLIYPERLLPWRASDIGKSIQTMASGHPMIPFARSAQRIVEKGQTRFLSFSEGMARAKSALAQTADGADPAQVGIRMNYAYLQKEIESVAMDGLRGKPFQDEWAFAAALSEERVKVMGQVLSDPEYARRLQRQAIDDPAGMTNYLDSFEGRGTSLENFAEHQRATEYLQRQVSQGGKFVHVTSPEAAAAIKKEGFKVGEGGGFSTQDYGPGVYLSGEEAAGYWRSEFETAEEVGRRASDVVRADVNAENALTFSLLSQSGKQRSIRAALQEADESLVGRFDELVSGKVDEKKALAQVAREKGYQAIVREGRGGSVEEVVAFDAVNVSLPTMNAVPAVKGKYQTRQDVFKMANEYENAAKTYQQAWASSDKVVGPFVTGEQADSVVAAGRRLDEVLSDMADRGLIDDQTAFRLRGRAENGDPLYDPKVTARLKEIAETRAREVPELTQSLQEQGFDRYIAVETGENMLRYDHISDLLETTGVSAYTRHQQWFDLMASVVKKRDDVLEIGRGRYNAIAAELDLAGADIGLEMTGKEMVNHINKSIRTRYDIDAARARGEQVSSWGPVASIQRPFGKTTRELFKVSPTDLTPDNLIEAFHLDDIPGIDDPWAAANRIKAAVQEGSAFGASAMRFPMHPVQQARALGRAMGMSGLQGFNDFMRTLHLPTKMTGVMPKYVRNYVGWLPQSLHRTSMALRYSLSPSFDMGRYIEQASLGTYAGEIPVAASFTPRRFLAKREWKSPYSNEPVTDELAVQHAFRFYDEEILGRVAMSDLDELQMRLLHRGVLGFKPREAEAAQAWWLYQKAAKKGPVSAETISEIRTKIMEIGRYGTGQSALAKSAHFIWFPALFQFKMFRHLHDFALGAPVRNLLIHQGFERWYKVNSSGQTMADQFSEFMEKHIPIADEIGRLNNLSFGLGPGRFFLEGIADKSDVGKAGQAITAFMVPGGSHQPLHEFFGGVTEAAGQKVERFVPDNLKHLFVPVVVTEDTPAEQLLALSERLVPAYRDLENFIFGRETTTGGFQPGALADQWKALPGVGEGSSATWQLQEYQDAKRDLDSEMEASLGPLAESMGYASLDGFLQSDAGSPIKDIINAADQQLGMTYPSGKELANRFTNTPEMKEQFLYNLTQKDDRTEAEDAIRMIGEIEAQVKLMAEQNQMSQEDGLRLAAPSIRSMAQQMYRDPQFRQLWDRWFSYTYGPIARVLTSAVTST